MTKKLNYLLVGLVLLAGLVGAVYFLRSRLPKLVSSPADSPRSRGPAGAPIQIIEFSDFQCPACQVAQPLLQGLLAQHPEKIRLVYKHFPLQAHRWAFVAHQAAECAARQNKFWSFHDRLYKDQSLWSAGPEPPFETFLRYAKEEALDLDRFAACLSDKKVSETINQERLAGVGLGVRSTPSFFVNGKLTVGGKGLEEEMKKRLETEPAP